MMFLQIVTVSTLIWVAQPEKKVCSHFCSSLGMIQSNPGKSCNDIYQINKATRERSDYYWINTTTGVHQVFCDMELECGGHKGGWMKIADLDTTRGDKCSTGWTKITTPNTAGNPATVVCRSPNDKAGCYSTHFTVNGTSFHKICGRARGYQKGYTDAFHRVSSSSRTINEAYIDGISITLGIPRKHIWSYAIGIVDNDRDNIQQKCPCAANPGDPAHNFLRDHYYCESGTTATQNSGYYTSDPLWDGNGCVATNNNCCSEVGLPWFYRQFPTAQDDDIEVRLCTDQSFIDEGVLVDQLQLFVQ